MSDMADKRSNLAAWMLTELQEVDSSYAVETRYRADAIYARNPKDRKRICGDPVRYCEVLHTGIGYPEDDPQMMFGTGTPWQRTDTFQVQLWHEYKDNDTYANSSQSTWDGLMDGADSLIKQLAEINYITSAGEIGIPQGVVIDLIQVDGIGKVLCHYAIFTIGVTS